MTGIAYDGGRRAARVELRRKCVEDLARGRTLDLGQGPSGPYRPEVHRVISVEEADRSVGLLGSFVVETVGGVEYVVDEDGEVQDVEGNPVGFAVWADEAFYYGRS